MSTGETEALLTVIYLGMIPVAFLIYAIPSIIAFRRRHPNRFAILVINIAFGGTGIGWLGALVWALGAVHIPNEAGGSYGGESGLNLFVNDPKAVRFVGPPLATGAGGGTPASAALTTLAAVGEIERLSALRASGVLSEPEFIDLKADVLRRVRVRASA
ncbi:superinfection immunity protein [Methylobacterium trifolii]|uniref:Superinfection immunity protein n=1 Tax=Methylobacterium trifolii TaxID=1003092 RepID=A0ABQ4U5Q2_9HYPH|nr:superinfection immunity protein [Methylobacterium trifolii]GJE62106.1 hypothetical protein MPOCJGCO_4236 [Methylobacterium trifolii]